MKAILLCGGEGTRLRPLTCRTPKPMVRLFDRPLLDYTLDWLAGHGVTEVAITLRYRPYRIREHVGDGSRYGLSVSYFTESEPLGTAGAVGACREFCGNGEVLVVSGDALCDFNLSDALRFHAEHNAEATVLLYSHPEPLSFGIVQTDVRDRIVGFAEKPGWGEVFTDRINTGIYVLSPAALARIPEGRPYDFSRDLFPAMLACDAPLYATAMEGYWRDVGDPEAYLTCLREVLDGRISLPIAPQGEPPEGVCTEGPVYLSPAARFDGPCRIGPYTVIGAGAHIGRDCELSGCAVCGSLGSRVQARDCIVAQGARIDACSQLQPGSVVGTGAHVGAGAEICEGVRIFPEVSVEPGVRVEDTLPDKSRWLAHTETDGLSGSLCCELTPAFFLRLGNALAREGHVLLCGGEPDWALYCICAGAGAAGLCCLSADCPFPAVTALCTRLYGADLSVDLRREGERLRLRFYGADGLPLPQSALAVLNARLAAGAEPMPVREGTVPRRICCTTELYTSLAAQRFRCKGACVGAREGSPEAAALRLAGAVVRADAEPFFALSPDGFGFTAREGALFLDVEHALCALCAAVIGSKYSPRLVLPYAAPALLDGLARQAGVQLLRTGRDVRAAELLGQSPEYFHGLFGMLLLCHLLCTHRITLSALAGGTPDFLTAQREVPVSEGRAAGMRRLGREFPAAERAEGFRILRPEGCVHVRPAADREALTLVAEARRAEFADELCRDIEKIIADRQKET